MSATERQLYKLLTEERQARQKGEEDMRRDFMAQLEELHAKLDEPLLAALQKPSTPAASSASMGEVATMRQELQGLKASIAALEQNMVTESKVRVLLTERFEQARVSQHATLNAGLETIQSMQQERLNELELYQAEMRTGLDEMSDALLQMGKSEKTFDMPGRSRMSPAQKLEEWKLLRQLQVQLKELEETHNVMAKQNGDQATKARLVAASPTTSEVIREVSLQQNVAEIGGMVNELVQHLKVQSDAHADVLDDHTALLDEHTTALLDIGNKVSIMESSVVDLSTKHALTAVQATKLSLRSVELTNANRVNALRLLEAREKKLKEEITKMQTRRESTHSQIELDKLLTVSPTNGESASTDLEAAL